jgi:hypothetical protein
MAALDFPASPTDGQVYNNWIYSTSKGAWKAKPLTGQKSVPSATAPASPSAGDNWFNTNDGNLYVYYTDVDGSQWVQVKSDATLSSTLGTRVTTLETYPSGLVPIIPTSVTIGSGSSSTNSSGAVTFSGASTVSLNGVFSSAYKNYQIIIGDFASSNNAVAMRMRMRTSGTDNSAASYYQAGASAASANPVGYTSSGATNFLIGDSSTSKFYSLSATLTNPFIASETAGVFNLGGYSNAVTWIGGNLLHNGSASFDGVSIFPASGTISGTMQVYGLR